MFKSQFLMAFILWTFLVGKAFCENAPAEGSPLGVVQYTPSTTGSPSNLPEPFHRIELDRPDDGSLVVHQGALQIENGITRTWNSHGNDADAPETLLRLGVTDNTELRLLMPDYFMGHGNLAHTGFSDIGLGLKRRLIITSSGFNVAGIAMLGLPTGTHQVSSHGFDPSLRFPWSRPLKGPWSASGRASFFWPTINGRHDLTVAPAVSVDRKIGRNADVFVEYEQDTLQFGRPRSSVTLGGFKRIKPRQVVDMYIALGCTQASPTVTLGLGYTFHLDNLLK